MKTFRDFSGKKIIESLTIIIEECSDKKLIVDSNIYFNI